MIGSLVINLEQELEGNDIAGLSPAVEAFKGLEDNEYNINIQTSLEENLTDIMSSKPALERMLEDYQNIFGVSEQYAYIKEKVTRGELFSDSQEVTIFGKITQVREYIKRNPFLNGKKICLGESVSLDKKELEQIKSIFGADSNLMVRIEGNTKGVSLDIYEKTIEAIDEIVNKIKKYNYTPYETLIHVYDLVRDKFYNMEEEHENYSISRDLSNVLLGDKIVCLGFANIFNTVIRKLGLNSIIFSLSLPNDEPGHARILTYINDKEYDIDGLYFFDPTFDCKKNESNDFLASYRFFGKTKEEIDRLSGYNFIYDTYDLFSFDEVGDLEDTLENEVLTIEDMIVRVKSSRVNRMLRLLGKPVLDVAKTKYTKDEIMDIICEISDLANKPIDAPTFLKALYKVRKNEYYENPQKYLFDMNALTNILINSKIVSSKKTKENDLLAALFGIKRSIGEEEAISTVTTYLEENNLDLDLERVRLTRLLKTISEQESSKKLTK